MPMETSAGHPAGCAAPPLRRSPSSRKPPATTISLPVSTPADRPASATAAAAIVCRRRQTPSRAAVTGTRPSVSVLRDDSAATPTSCEAAAAAEAAAAVAVQPETVGGPASPADAAAAATVPFPREHAGSSSPVAAPRENSNASSGADLVATASQPLFLSPAALNAPESAAAAAASGGHRKTTKQLPTADVISPPSQAAGSSSGAVPEAAAARARPTAARMSAARGRRASREAATVHAVSMTGAAAGVVGRETSAAASTAAAAATVRGVSIVEGATAGLGAVSALAPARASEAAVAAAASLPVHRRDGRLLSPLLSPLLASQADIELAFLAPTGVGVATEAAAGAPVEAGEGETQAAAGRVSAGPDGVVVGRRRTGTAAAQSALPLERGGGEVAFVATAGSEEAATTFSTRVCSSRGTGDCVSCVASCAWLPEYARPPVVGAFVVGLPAVRQPDTLRSRRNAAGAAAGAARAAALSVLAAGGRGAAAAAEVVWGLATACFATAVERGRQAAASPLLSSFRSRSFVQTSGGDSGSVCNSSSSSSTTWVRWSAYDSSSERGYRRSRSGSLSKTDLNSGRRNRTERGSSDEEETRGERGAATASADSTSMQQQQPAHRRGSRASRGREANNRRTRSSRIRSKRNLRIVACTPHSVESFRADYGVCVEEMRLPAAWGGCCCCCFCHDAAGVKGGSEGVLFLGCGDGFVRALGVRDLQTLASIPLSSGANTRRLPRSSSSGSSSCPLSSTSSGGPGAARFVPAESSAASAAAAAGEVPVFSAGASGGAAMLREALLQQQTTAAAAARRAAALQEGGECLWALRRCFSAAAARFYASPLSRYIRAACVFPGVFAPQARQAIASSAQRGAAARLFGSESSSGNSSRIRGNRERRMRPCVLLCPLNNSLIAGDEDGDVRAYFLETQQLAVAYHMPSSIASLCVQQRRAETVGQQLGPSAVSCCCCCSRRSSSHAPASSYCRMPSSSTVAVTAATSYGAPCRDTCSIPSLHPSAAAPGCCTPCHPSSETSSHDSSLMSLAPAASKKAPSAFCCCCSASSSRSGTASACCATSSTTPCTTAATALSPCAAGTYSALSQLSAQQQFSLSSAASSFSFVSVQPSVFDSVAYSCQHSHSSSFSSCILSPSEASSAANSGRHGGTNVSTAAAADAAAAGVGAGAVAAVPDACCRSRHSERRLQVQAQQRLDPEKTPFAVSTASFFEEKRWLIVAYEPRCRQSEEQQQRRRQQQQEQRKMWGWQQEREQQVRPSARTSLPPPFSASSSSESLLSTGSPYSLTLQATTHNVGRQFMRAPASLYFDPAVAASSSSNSKGTSAGRRRRSSSSIFGMPPQSSATNWSSSCRGRGPANKGNSSSNSSTNKRDEAGATRDAAAAGAVEEKDAFMRPVLFYELESGRCVGALWGCRSRVIAVCVCHFDVHPEASTSQSKQEHDFFSEAKGACMKDESRTRGGPAADRAVGLMARTAGTADAAAAPHSTSAAKVSNATAAGVVAAANRVKAAASNKNRETGAAAAATVAGRKRTNRTLCCVAITENELVVWMAQQQVSGDRPAAARAAASAAKGRLQQLQQQHVRVQAAAQCCPSFLCGLASAPHLPCFLTVDAAPAAAADASHAASFAVAAGEAAVHDSAAAAVSGHTSLDRVGATTAAGSRSFATDNIASGGDATCSCCAATIRRETNPCQERCSNNEYAACCRWRELELVLRHTKKIERIGYCRLLKAALQEQERETEGEEKTITSCMHVRQTHMQQGQQQRRFSDPQSVLQHQQQPTRQQQSIQQQQRVQQKEETLQYRVQGRTGDGGEAFNAVWVLPQQGEAVAKSRGQEESLSEQLSSNEGAGSSRMSGRCGRKGINSTHTRAHSTSTNSACLAFNGNDKGDSLAAAPGPAGRRCATRSGAAAAAVVGSENDRAPSTCAAAGPECSARETRDLGTYAVTCAAAATAAPAIACGSRSGAAVGDSAAAFSATGASAAASAGGGAGACGSAAAASACQDDDTVEGGVIAGVPWLLAARASWGVLVQQSYPQLCAAGSVARRHPTSGTDEAAGAAAELTAVTDQTAAAAGADWMCAAESEVVELSRAAPRPYLAAAGGGGGGGLRRGCDYEERTELQQWNAVAGTVLPGHHRESHVIVAMSNQTAGRSSSSSTSTAGCSSGSSSQSSCCLVVLKIRQKKKDTCCVTRMDRPLRTNAGANGSNLIKQQTDEKEIDSETQKGERRTHSPRERCNVQLSRVLVPRPIRFQSTTWEARRHTHPCSDGVASSIWYDRESRAVVMGAADGTVRVAFDILSPPLVVSKWFTGISAATADLAGADCG